MARLLEQTRRRSAPLLEFADAVRDLSRILAGADGSSLQPFYPRVPEPLQGFVELIYDVHNQPAIRFLESLLYRSRYYDESAQGLHFSVVNRDDRPFVFSTPRLADDGRLSLSLPYRAEGLDRVFRMRDEPQPLAFAKEALDISGAADERFEGLFTERAAPAVGAAGRLRSPRPLLRARLRADRDPRHDDPDRPGHRIRPRARSAARSASRTCPPASTTS